MTWHCRELNIAFDIDMKYRIKESYGEPPSSYTMWGYNAITTVIYAKLSSERYAKHMRDFCDMRLQWIYIAQYPTIGTGSFGRGTDRRPDLADMRWSCR